MADRLRGRRAVVAALLLAVAAAIALPLTLGDGDGGDRRATPPERREPASTAPTRERTTEARTRTAPRRRRRREAADVARAVTALVEAVEQGDAERACAALGQDPRGGGPSAVQDCARRAGVSLDGLPTSDELSIDRVEASPGRATVRLGGGAALHLRRSGGRWTVERLVPPRIGGR